jgi:GTP-binding protein Era
MKIPNGKVAIVGRPNVGKSTILNKVANRQHSITANKAQTTRGTVIYNHTSETLCVKFVDTAGYVINTKHLLDKLLNKSIISWSFDCDLIFFVVSAGTWGIQEDYLLEQIQKLEKRIVLVINKTDRLDSYDLIDFIKFMSGKFSDKDMVSVSAIKNVKPILNFLKVNLPIKDVKEDNVPLLETPKELIISEVVREQIFRFTGDEVPRSSAVKVVKFEDGENLIKIEANILVEKKSHRKIMVGSGGNKIKEIGIISRSKLEKMLDKKVFLKLLVFVEPNWANKEDILLSYNALSLKEYHN